MTQLNWEQILDHPNEKGGLTFRASSQRYENCGYRLTGNSALLYRPPRRQGRRASYRLTGNSALLYLVEGLNGIFLSNMGLMSIDEAKSFCQKIEDYEFPGMFAQRDTPDPNLTVQTDFATWLNDHFHVGFSEVPASEIIASAREENIRLCIGKGHRDHECRFGRDWTMSIPLQNDDSDMIFDRLADYAEMLEKRLCAEIFSAKQ